MSKLLLASAAAALLAVANAQSAPDWALIPKACATDCAKTIEASYLCQQQYSVGTAVYGCFCEAAPSDATGCADCMNKNNAAALASLLTSTSTDCPKQEKACAFACAFNTCDSKDVACQCDPGYLSNIYNCASCNSANGNQGTQLADFKALNESCGAQSYTGAMQQFTTWVNHAGTEGYAAPTLTATGGGDAATGTFSAATDKAAATAGNQASGAAASASGSKSAAAGGSSTASASKTSGAAASGASGASPSATKPAATTAPAGAANGLVAPIGLVAAVAAFAALL